MDLPLEIKRYIENESNLIHKNELYDNAQKISMSYRNNEGKGKRLLKEDKEAVAYAISRMPATYGAVYNALKYTLDIYNPEIQSMADIGAGTGTASIAANELIDLKQINCFEREPAMQKIGKKIFESYNDLNGKAQWNNCDICNDEINERYDLVVTSYMINELSEDIRKAIVEKLWNITEKILLIVEPGTVQGYRNIMDAKKRLIDMGAKVIAPCMSNECRLPKDDWCNFSCRVQRTKIHKELKSGNVPYEDEKYMYIAVSKEEMEEQEKSRILRHPMIYSGFIKLKVCNKDEIKEITVTKKNKEKFKVARKADAGDLI